MIIILNGRVHVVHGVLADPTMILITIRLVTMVGGMMTMSGTKGLVIRLLKMILGEIRAFTWMRCDSLLQTTLSILQKEKRIDSVK